MLNALINVINFVPRILINDRFNGALMSILASVVIGTSLLLLFVHAISAFPSKGLPEILESSFPRPLRNVILLLFSGLWYVAGAITLVSFVDITLHFINPELSPHIIMSGFLVVVCLAIRYSSISILFALEAILILNFPFVIYFLWKTLSSPHFSWDAIGQVVTHLWEVPTYDSIMAATFIFSGYINLVIFNRVFNNVKMKHLWLIFFLGLITLLSSFLIPIGYLGTIGVGLDFYSWFTTADSIKMEYSIVERLIYVFYLIYLTMSLVSTIVHWHVGYELLKGIFRYQPNSKKQKTIEYTIIGGFALMTLFALKFQTIHIILIGGIFLNMRFVGEVLLLALVRYSSWRIRKNG